MALVAKKYQSWRQIEKPYYDEITGKKVIVVTNDKVAKAVRVYTQEQYDFLKGMAYANQLAEEERAAVAQSYNYERKVKAGFEKGYIIAILGETYPKKDALKRLGACYKPGLGWHFVGGEESKTVAKENRFLGFETRRVLWEEVSEELDSGAVVLKDEFIIKRILMQIPEIESNSKHQGQVGALMKKLVYLKDSRVIDGEVGRHVMEFYEDNDENIYLVNSSVANMKDKRVYQLLFEVIRHTSYAGVEQTVVKIIE